MDLKAIDALIAEHIMGLEVCAYYGFGGAPNDELVTVCRSSYPNNGYFKLPSYSTDIKIAWEIIEKLDYLWFEVGRENCCGVRYDCVIYNNPELEDKVIVTKSTASLAICLAALKIKGIEYES